MEDSVFVESTGCHHGQRQHVQLAGLLKPVGVNTQHCLCIVAALPAFHQFHVPVGNSSHVAVDLKKKGFAPEQLLRLSAGPAGPPTVDCPVIAKLQVRVLWQVACSPGVRVRVGQLKADPLANSLRFCRLRQKVVQCCWKIRVSIGRDLDKDRWVGWVHCLRHLPEGFGHTHGLNHRFHVVNTHDRYPCLHTPADHSGRSPDPLPWSWLVQHGTDEAFA